MTDEQARKMQHALRAQSNARARLEHAEHIDLIKPAARTYIAATDHLYTTAREIQAEETP